MVNEEPHLPPYPHQTPHDFDHVHNHEHEFTSNSSKSMILISITILFSILISLYINYKPRHLSLSIYNVQIPTFIGSYSGSTVSFILSFEGTVSNPTRSDFSYSSSTADVFYAGKQVGSLFIPGRFVAAGLENVMEASINVNPVPLSTVGLGYIPVMYGLKRAPKPTIEVELRMKIVGRKSQSWFFDRHVWTVNCRIGIVILDGSLLYVSC
ncbi:uncharacterized protein LOC110722514 [Chenopodium quinoa]|uniref:Late embryogenesis abundant protein LEA-2 subgroup domain-containing protein n=1 Tax=Chenopodium quinoa TaxID=63459 RepID=A0A803LWK0_CHEQI|nr:uncharacterized protein LOC110722514 [Chenopodium quinoa]